MSKNNTPTPDDTNTGTANSDATNQDVAHQDTATAGLTADPTTPDVDGDTGTDTTGAADSAAPSSALAATPKIAWVLTALIATGTALGGYIVGHQVGENSTKETINQTVEAALNAPGSAAQGGRNAQPQSFAEITKKLKPGADTAGPKPTDGSTFNANITGGRGPVKGPEDAYNVHRRNPYDPFAIGRVDAPVVISEFSDFECPFCSRFANIIEPALVKKYVDTGYVRIEYNDLPINGPHAIAAAKAARAAAAQGRFPEFAQALFTASKNIKGHPGFEMKDFLNFARTAGVPDIDKFEKDASGDTYLPAVKKAGAYAQQLGIHSTPSFVVGGILVEGAQPLEKFEQAINSQLQKVANGSVKVPAPDDKAGVN